MKTHLKKKKRVKEKRGKWSRDPWIRILELLDKMPVEERHRCIRATKDFYENKD